MSEVFAILTHLPILSGHPRQFPILDFRQFHSRSVGYTILILDPSNSCGSIRLDKACLRVRLTPDVR